MVPRNISRQVRALGGVGDELGCPEARLSGGQIETVPYSPTEFSRLCISQTLGFMNQSVNNSSATNIGCQFYEREEISAPRKVKILPQN